MSVINVPVTKVNNADCLETSDALAIEEPMEIRLEYKVDDELKNQSVSVTMRTPGNDAELAAGFLFTEGIVGSAGDIANIDHCFIACAENKENVIQVKLKEGIAPDLKNTGRNFYTTSSCGVCGKGSIDAIRTVGSFIVQNEDLISADSELLYTLPDILLGHQRIFGETGGLHASALFSLDGELLLVREDVGRHNALDKLIGAALKQGILPLDNHILLLSGRASFELVQKAVMAGIKIIAAVGAPSSLAVELAAEFNVTLAGFLRNRRFNIYTAGRRILFPVHEGSN
ncbi:formate dehydrogenase accessory sulfurtransferase FdhD [Mucilaginibacter sp. L3T2-6]|uniref:formate dehydrogenase accessory sulfurtransferase FdhD n=1 Tax=Mucilaginibacter sp. L3T2-6 TaxID=3062491 RepID=UPI0026759C45|nr:formate dehydrogenase accessory sulfurtransferase FdhD [Mucilaginibacter sp. L3T2-6]MDO3641210.1 formate dehydrogenase accessory sulfurtransferase FdhD [Mucilaginibacter sp. L3T2-6]MDV6213314.1 formate dehydrogenase accessory sulfurtransferase FdhD [Mucilaginibacter sp. L3T2-6]